MCAELCGLLDGQVIDGVEIAVSPVKEHRFIAVFRGEGLSHEVTDSDPEQTGVPPLKVNAEKPEAQEKVQAVITDSQHVYAFEEIATAFKAAQQSLVDHDKLLVLGSFYTVAAVLKEMQ